MSGKPDTRTLVDLLDQIDDGRLRLPEFQRPFNWVRSARIALLDSIQKDYPVGTLLFLEVSPGKTSSLFGQRRFEETPDPTNDAQHLVLDGQQRLTTCYHTYRSPGRKNVFCVDLRALYSKSAEQAKLPEPTPVDLADVLIVRRRLKQIDSLLYGNHLLPIEFTLDPKTLRGVLVRYRKNLEEDPAEAGYAQFIDLDLYNYVEAMGEYEFPIVFLSADLDIEAVANIFTKINTTGLKLSAFDLCVATLYPSGVRLRAMLDLAREKDGINAVDDDGTNILQTVALLAGKAPKKAALPKNIGKVQIDAQWDRAVNGLLRAADRLSDVGVATSKDVPYDALVPALGAALETVPTPTSPADMARESRLVARWVLQTAFQQRYNEGTDVKQASDWIEVVTWLQMGPTPPFLDDPIAWTSASARMGRTGARARALLAVLNGQSPRDMITSKRLALGEAQLHHIFPLSYLTSKRGLEKAEANRALNLTLLSPASNNFIQDDPPSVYLPRLVADHVNAGASEASALAELQDVLSDHLISVEAYEALIADDYERFIDLRGKALIGLLNQKWWIPVVEAAAEPDEAADEGAEEPPDDDV